MSPFFAGYMRAWIAVHVVALGILAIGAACVPPSSSERAAAEAGYTAEQLACVEHAATREASRACRAEVDRRWGVVRPVVVPVRTFVDAAKDGGR